MFYTFRIMNFSLISKDTMDMARGRRLAHTIGSCSPIGLVGMTQGPVVLLFAILAFNILPHAIRLGFLGVMRATAGWYDEEARA